jgi:23S rRNA pseudouridine2605 synthase
MPSPAKRSKQGKDEKPPKTRRTRVGEERPKRSTEAEKPDFGEKPFRRNSPSYGDKPRFSDKPYKKKEFGDKSFNSERPTRQDKSFKKKAFGDKPYKKKEFGDKPFNAERPTRQDKPFNAERPTRQDKPFKKKEWGDKLPRGEKSSFRDKPTYRDKPESSERKKDWGEKRSFGKREESEPREQKSSYKSYKEKGSYRDKPAREERPSVPGERTPFDDKPHRMERPAFRNKPEDHDKSSIRDKKSGEDKPERFYKKTEEDRGAKKNFSRPYDKARERASEDRPSKSFNAETPARQDKPFNPKRPARQDKPFSAERPSRQDKPFREKKSFATPQPASADGLIRLNKYIANAGVCSRREADKLIETGVISVNGKIITELGFKVSPGDEINFGGQTLRKEKAVYVLLNKPKDYITTLDDPEGRKTVLELIKNATRERVYPVGRLDRNTTGLLLLTNDGDMTKKLTHPRYGVKKIYQVSLNKALTKTDMQKISDGIELEDGPVKADDISYVGDGKDKNEIGIQLHSGRNRIVRRIFEHLGYDVVKLDRVYFAGLTKKDLPRGRWRLLNALEISMLKMVPGE